MVSNFKLHARETIHVRDKTFIISIEESQGLFRAQARVRWKDAGMEGIPLTTSNFKDKPSAVKQITTELERLLKGGEVQSGAY